MFTVDTRMRVKYYETDQMGVVHHSNYYRWFETAREEFMRAKGLSYDQMEKMGFMLPLIETHCFYKKGAKYDDIVIVRSKVTRFKGIRLTMEYDVIREADGELLAQGSTVHAFTDCNLKPINIKRECPNIYDLFKECLE